MITCPNRGKFLATALMAGCITLPLAQTANAAPVQLLTNGDFETGDFTGWTKTDGAFSSPGGFSVNPYFAPTPLNGLPTPPNPAGGGFFAVSDGAASGHHALTQSFTVAPGASVSLSFDMFLNDWSLPPGAPLPPPPPPPTPPFTPYPIVDSSGLDFTTGGTFSPNQHARVDILTGTALPFSTLPSDVLMSILAPVPAPALFPGTNPFLPSPVIDLTGALGAGGTFQVRFAEVHNLGPLNLGVDNVSILSTVTSVPEPGTLTLFGLGLAGLALKRRRRQVS